MGQRVFKRGAAVVAVLALVSAMLGVVSSSPSVAADCGERVLLVAGSSPAPAGDAALVDALAGRSPGASCVVVVDDDVVTVAQAEGFDVVVIASSVLPLRLGDRLVDAQVPVLVSEPFLFDDMAMTVGTGKELVGRTSVKISDASHRLAGGLSGTVTVLETAAKVNYGVDGRAPGIEAVANTGGSSPRMTIFGFAAGAELTDRVAAAGRVGFFASYGADLTDDGTTLFNAAIDWLVGQGVSEPTDGDAVTDVVDNCPYIGGEVFAFNILQRDTDHDGVGDSCDPSSTALSSGLFTDSGQLGGSLTSSGAQLGDLDGDGDLDAVVSNQNFGVTTPLPSRVWFNDGSGSFTDSGQAIRTGERGSIWVELGDVDGDGDLDIILSGPHGQIWLNDGAGVFTDSGQALGDQESLFVPGDFDGDDDLDLISGDWISSDGVANRVWLNDGAGVFTDSGQLLGSDILRWSGIGDLDADGDVDAFISGASDSRVWFNNGNGVFTDSGQRLGIGGSSTWGVGLGDLDADGDLDAFVTTTGNAPDQVWLNDGTGTFTDSGQRIGADSNVDVELGDLDGDGDLDAFVPANGSPYVDRVWINDGTGNFSDSGQALGASRSQGVALGDLDGDQDLDAYIANWWGTNFVYLNDVNTEPPPRALLVAGNSSPPPGDRDIVEIVEGAGVDVTVVDDDSDLAAIVASDYDVIVVSTSVVPSKVGDVFVDVLVPVVIWEPFLFDDMAMTERGPRETSATYRDIAVVDATHPLADGLPVGNARVYDVARTLSYGAATDAAEIVAHVPGRSSQDVMFVLDPGDVRADGSVSPALRVGLFPTYPGALRLSDQGKALIASAVEWVLAGGPPGNDDFADRFTLTGTTATGDNVGATQEDGEPYSSVERSVWWEWTATIDGLAYVDITTDFDAITAVYAGDSLATLDRLAIDYAYRHELVFRIEAGQTYQFAIGGRFDADEQGDYEISIVEAVRPANDDFVNSTAVGEGVHSGTNVGATLQPGEPRPYGFEDQIGEASVWWSWTPAVDGVAHIDTEGSNFDTVLGIWSGDQLTSLTGVSDDDDGGPGLTSVVDFRVIGGTTYRVAVYGYRSSRGDIVLTIDLDEAVVPVNDNFADAASLVGATATVTGNNNGATLEPGEPLPPYAEDSDGSIWWRWTAPADGMYVFDAAGTDSSQRPAIGIWQGATLATLVLAPIDSDYYSWVELAAEAGQDYSIAVYREPDREGDVQLNVRSQLPVGPDGLPGSSYSSAIALDGAGFPVVAFDSDSQLNLMHCNDAACEGGDESLNVVGADSVYLLLGLALDSNGFPVIAYDGPGRITVVHCNDVDCAGDDETFSSVSDATGDEPFEGAFALDSSDNPVILVYESVSSPFYTGSDLDLIRCNDPDCAGSDDSAVNVDSVGSSGLAVSVAVNDLGHPVLAGLPAITVTTCDDVNCAGSTWGTLDSEPSEWVSVAGQPSSIRLDADGYPVVGFSSGGQAGVIRCDDDICAGDNETIVTTPESPYDARDVYADVDSAGRAVIAWIAGGAGDTLRIARCDDSTCAGPTITDVEWSGGRSNLLGMEIDPATNAVTVLYSSEYAQFLKVFTLA